MKHKLECKPLVSTLKALKDKRYLQKGVPYYQQYKMDIPDKEKYHKITEEPRLERTPTDHIVQPFMGEEA